MFNSLSRPQGMSGIARISQQEIAAYLQNHALKLNSFELDLLSLIDGIAIEVFSKGK